MAEKEEKTYPCEVIHKIGIGSSDNVKMIDSGEIVKLTKDVANKLIKAGAVIAIIE